MPSQILLKSLLKNKTIVKNIFNINKQINKN